MTDPCSITPCSFASLLSLTVIYGRQAYRQTERWTERILLWRKSELRWIK